MLSSFLFCYYTTPAPTLNVLSIVKLYKKIFLSNFKKECCDIFVVKHIISIKLKFDEN